MISAAVCDDDLEFGLRMKEWIDGYGGKRHQPIVTEVYTSAEELVREMRSGSAPDVIFLDIELPGMNGVELGLKLRETGSGALLVYVSGYDRYLKELFEAEPFRFLSKPFSQEELTGVLDAAVSRIERGKREIFRFQSGRTIISLHCRDILYLESRLRKIIVHCAEGTYSYYGKLDDEEKRMAAQSSRFIRIHKAFLVNIDQVEAFEHDRVALRDKTILNVSEANRAAVRSRFWAELG